MVANVCYGKSKRYMANTESGPHLESVDVNANGVKNNTVHRRAVWESVEWCDEVVQRRRDVAIAAHHGIKRAVHNVVKPRENLCS